MEIQLLRINAKDNVAVALRDIPAGALLEAPGGGEMKAAGDIPYGHKVALIDIAEGDPVIKYGETIGHASREIVRGEWVHTRNMGATEVNG